MEKKFRLYLIGNFISCIGTGMQFIANAWLVLNLSGHKYSVAAVLFFSALPGVLLSMNTGKIVDSYDRKNLAVFMDVGRGVAILPVIFYCLYGKLSVWHFYILSFVSSLGEQIYTPAMLALLKEILPEEKLLMANARISVGTQGGLLAGSIVGGICIASCGPIFIFLINMGSYFFSAFCICKLRPVSLLPYKNDCLHKTIYQEMVWGGHYLLEHTKILKIYLIMVFFFTTVKIINVLLPVHCQQDLSANSTAFGVIDASFAIGAMTGGSVMPFLVKRRGKIFILLCCSLGLSFGVGIFAWLNKVILAMLGYFIIGFFIQGRILCLTETQELIENDCLGRIQSLYNMIFSWISLVIYYGLGILIEIWPLERIYMIYACLLLIPVFIEYRDMSYKKGVSMHEEHIDY